MWQVWLQEFAWTESEKLSKIKARGSSLPDNHGIMMEPMFCFETAIKMYYYAHMVGLLPFQLISSWACILSGMILCLLFDHTQS